MFLSLGLRVVDQGTGRQAARVGQDRPRHLNLIVRGKLLITPDGACSTGASWRLRPLPGFNARDKVTQDIVEHLDLVFAQTVSAMQEEIRDLPKGADPLCR